MERTKGAVAFNLPDAINCSITKEFTQIPNDLLRNPEISGKAKSILFLLLSKRKRIDFAFPLISGLRKRLLGI